MCLSMLPKTSTFKSLSYCKTPFNIPRFGRKYFSYSQHVGIWVRVAQSTFAFKCLSQRLTLCLFQCQYVSLCSLPQIRVNCRAGRALEHTEGLLWYLVVKESKTATCQLGVQQPNQALSTSQTKCQSHSETSCDVCMFRCKTCPFRARTQNSCKKLSRNQNEFSSCQRQKSPAQSGAAASIRLQSPLLSTHHRLHVPATYLCPQIIHGGFWGGKNQPKSMQRKALFVFNQIFTSTTSVGEERDNDTQ